ncbi:MAG: carbon-nitrogen hydrolase family protein [Fimbriimonadaceae bacterium]
MTIRVACVQTDVAFNDPATNVQRAIAHLRSLKDQGADLVVFPEAYLTGYCVGTHEEARKIAVPLEYDRHLRVTNPSGPVQDLQRACQDIGVRAVVGLIATDGTDVQNAALLFEPDGTVWRYFKTHLPHLGVDRFVVPGWDLPVFETEIGKIGMLVCYDLRVPEAARVLALQGADVIVLPTNWPEGAEMTPAHVAPARALENRVYLATCNRIGTENGVTFIGQSGIYDVVGSEMAKAGSGEDVIMAELDLSLAREKRTVIRPGEYELDIAGSRRPALYTPIVRT